MAENRKRHHWFRHRAELTAEPHPEALRVLSIDGGGIRGLIPAVILGELERRTGKRTGELFDLIAGTSTGGIIALGLAIPGPDRRPAYGAQDALAIYEEHGPKIFARSRRDMIHSLGSLLHEKYSAHGLEATLEHYYGDCRLSECVPDVLVTAYELSRRETFIFSSRAARLDPTADFPLKAAGRATSAAPTFFEPALVEELGGRRHVFVDGAIFANSPAMCAFAEVEREQLGYDLLLFSMGAGSMTRPFQYEEVRDWGVAQWARPMLNVVLDGVSQAVDVELRELLGPERYFRFQVSLQKASDDLDDVRPSNLAALKAEARALIASRSADLDHLCELLVR